MKPMGVLLITVSAVFLSGCGDTSGPQGGWNNGAWSGTTSSGIPVTFTLNHPHVEDWTITVTHHYADTTDIRTYVSPELTVGSDSTFGWNDSVYSDTLRYSFAFSGDFVSGDSVTGSWESTVYYNFPGTSGSDELEGNWTAKGP